MTPKQMFALWDAGIGFREMALLLLLRYLIRNGTITEGVPNVAFRPPEPYDDAWETARNNEPRLGYRDAH